MMLKNIYNPGIAKVNNISILKKSLLLCTASVCVTHTICTYIADHSGCFPGYPQVHTDELKNPNQELTTKKLPYTGPSPTGSKNKRPKPKEVGGHIYQVNKISNTRVGF